MKSRLILAFCILGFAQLALAQFKPGMIPVGGDIRALGSNGQRVMTAGASDVDGWNIDVAPTLGYYYSDHSAFGAALDLGYVVSHSQTNGAATVETHSLTYGFSPFWRYNQTLSDRFGLYHMISPSALYSYSNGSTALKLQGWQLGLSGQVGGYFFVTPKLSIEVGLASLGYIYRIDHANDAQVGKNHFYNLVLQPFQSLSVFFYF